MPAAMPFARNPALPTKPLVEFVDAKPNGFGFIVARKPRNVEFVQFVPLYAVESPARDELIPFMNARKIGSGDVPGAPVYANVAPRPAAMFACRFACAFRNSFTKPLFLMS